MTNSKRPKIEELQLLTNMLISLSNSIMPTKDDTRKNHVRTDKASTNIKLISNVSKNDNELNPKLNTCNYRHKQTNLILPK